MKFSELNIHTNHNKGGLSRHNIINKVMGIKEWGLIFILSIIWGGSFFFVGIAVKAMTPLTIVLCRVGFASIILLIIVRLTGKKMPVSLGLWGAFFIMGAMNNLIPFSLIVWGQTHIESSLACLTSTIFSPQRQLKIPVSHYLRS